ncbi:MAG: hypothetical protein KGL25_03200 [Gammaproteobacteria bacterium]|nr:hypothetical protein [Gammaproteobacteria bacterium]
MKKLTDAQKAYQQVIKDVSGNLSEYHLMLAQVDVAQRSGAISAAQAQVETAKLNERILESTDAGKFYAQSMQSFESSMAKAIVTGGSLSSVLSNLAAKFAEAAFQAALFGTGPMGSGTVASGGGLLGGLFTGALGLLGGGIDTSFISAHATGTSYAQGGMALVGENGPEAVSLPRGAKVFSAGVTRAQGNQQAAQPGLVHVIVSADSSANLAPIIQQIAGNVTATALTSYDQTVLPGSMARISNDPRARG